MTNFSIGILYLSHPHTENTEDGPVETLREYFQVGASAPDGRNWVLIGSEHYDEDAAQQSLSEAFNPEEAPDQWLEVEPSYGSDAWDNEAEYNLAAFEADAFGEPRPRWF